MQKASQLAHAGPTDAKLTTNLSERETAELIGEEYITGEFASENTDAVRRAYRKIAQVNDVLFEEIPVEVEFTAGDPYGSFEEMRDAIDETGVMKIFGGGTGTRYLSHEENLKGRATHDYFGHYLNNVDFSFSGEFQKWDAQKHHYPRECWGVLFAEVVGQVSAAYYLDGGFDNDRFRQRAIDTPDHWYTLAASVARDVE